MDTLTQHPPAAPQTASDAAKRALANFRRRRTYLIDPRTQFAITKQFLVVLLAAAGLAIGNYHVFQVVVLVEKPEGVERLIALGYVAALLGVSATLLVLMSLFFSHRIAGPARKISEAMIMMARKDLCVKVRLRDSDLLKGMAEALNAVNRDLRTALLEVDKELQRAQHLARNENADLHASLKRMSRQLSAFHLSDAFEVDQREIAHFRAQRTEPEHAPVNTLQ